MNHVKKFKHFDLSKGFRPSFSLNSGPTEDGRKVNSNSVNKARSGLLPAVTGEVVAFGEQIKVWRCTLVKGRDSQSSKAQSLCQASLRGTALLCFQVHKDVLSVLFSLSTSFSVLQSQFKRQLSLSLSNESQSITGNDSLSSNFKIEKFIIMPHSRRELLHVIHTNTEICLEHDCLFDMSLGILQKQAICSLV